jgi:hypothetical protein
VQAAWKILRARFLRIRDPGAAVGAKAAAVTQAGRAAAKVEAAEAAGKAGAGRAEVAGPAEAVVLVEVAGLAARSRRNLFRRSSGA